MNVTIPDNRHFGRSCLARIRFPMQPIVFYLAKLSREYTTFSELWELLAIYLAIKHFWHLLEGREFTIYTNHKPLTTAMSTSSNKYTSREIWPFNYLLQFSIAIHHIKGKDNAVANTLSWTEINSLETDVLSQDSIAAEQKSDTMLQDVLTNSSLKLREFPASFSNNTLYCNTNLANLKLYIPPALWRQPM